MSVINGTGGTGQVLKQSVIDAIPVTVEAVLGVATVTVADVNRMAVGHAFALDAKLGDLIELRLNGVVVAHGELVAAGEHFGVRITALADQA